MLLPFHFLLSGQSICPSSVALGVQGRVWLSWGDRWPTPHWGGWSAPLQGAAGITPTSVRALQARGVSLGQARPPSGRMVRAVLTGISADTLSD